MERQFIEQIISTNDFEKIVELAAKLWSGDQTTKKDRATSFLLWQSAYKLNPNDNLVCRRMGSCYRYGHGTEENDDIALQYYMPAALRNDTFSQYFVGLTLKEKKDSSCVEWFEKACNNGDADSAFELASLYLSGILVEKDEIKAEHYLEIVEQSQESTAAMDSMRLFYFGPNNNGERNLSKAIFWCKKAAAWGDTKAVGNLESLYEEAGLDISGCADFLKTVENNGEAYMWLYRYYKNGSPVNSYLGLNYLEKALSMKYIGANYELGSTYFNGFCGVEVNKEKAIDIWKKGIELNESSSILMCAYDYLNGEVSEKNVSYGLQLLEKAGELGNCLALKELGANCLFGYFGTTIDYNKSIEYLTASSKENSDADALLGYMYLNALGVEKDVNKAMEKFDEAISYNSSIVNNLLLRSYRNVGLSSEEETKILLKAANNNDTEAMVILYYQFKDGKGVEPDINQALDWLYKAVDMKDSKAFCELGNVYISGNEQIEKNEQKAFECYMHSYDLDMNASAALAIMKCYYFGIGTSRDLHKAENWAKEAVKNGNRASAHNLKNIELELYGETQGYTNYINFILNEGIKYNDEAFVVAYNHYRNIVKDYQTALTYIEKAVNNRNPDACYIYGYLFYNGELGLQKDIDKAYQIWEIGVQANSMESIGQVGSAYLKGEHYTYDVQKGIMYLTEAANRGNMVSAFELGLYYNTGLFGVPVDTSKGARYIELAAKLGHTEAKNELGTYYIQGSNGFMMNIEKGVALVKEAADAGSANAQFNMGNFYYNGKGVNRDFLTSIDYYKKAAAQGHADAEKILNLLRQQYNGI